MGNSHQNSVTSKNFNPRDWEVTDRSGSEQSSTGIYLYMSRNFQNIKKHSYCLVHRLIRTYVALRIRLQILFRQL